MSEKPKRGWFSFSLRDLMWFTVVVALAVAWFVEQRRAADLSVERRRLDAELSKEREWRSNLREVHGSGYTAVGWYKRIWGESPNLPQATTGRIMPARGHVSIPFPPDSQAPAPPKD